MNTKGELCLTIYLSSRRVDVWRWTTCRSRHGGEVWWRLVVGCKISTTLWIDLKGLEDDLKLSSYNLSIPFYVLNVWAWGDVMATSLVHYWWVCFIAQMKKIHSQHRPCSIVIVSFTLGQEVYKANVYIYMYGHTRPKILTTKGSEHECRASSHMGYYHLSVEGFVTWHGLGDKLSNYGTTCLCRAWWEHSSRSWGGVVVTFSSSGGLWEVCCQRFIKMSMIQTLQRPTMEVRGCNTIECYPTWAEIYRISLNEHHFYT